MALGVSWLRHWCPTKKSDVQSSSTTNGGPLARKREAEIVQDQPPALLSILCPVPTAGAWLFAQHWCAGQRGSQEAVYGCLLLGCRTLLHLSALDGLGNLLLTKQLCSHDCGVEPELPLQGLDMFFFLKIAVILLHDFKPATIGTHQVKLRPSHELHHAEIPLRIWITSVLLLTFGFLIS